MSGIFSINDIPVGLRQFIAIRKYTFSEWMSQQLDPANERVEVTLDVASGALSVDGVTICVVKVVGGLFVVDDLERADKALLSHIQGDFHHESIFREVIGPDLGGANGPDSNHMVSQYISGVNGSVKLRDIANSDPALVRELNEGVTLKYGKARDLDNQFVSLGFAETIIRTAEKTVADQKIAGVTDPLVRAEVDKGKDGVHTSGEADKLIAKAIQVVAEKKAAGLGYNFISAVGLDGNDQLVLVSAAGGVVDPDTYKSTMMKVVTVRFSGGLSRSMIFSSDRALRP